MGGSCSCPLAEFEFEFLGFRLEPGVSPGCGVEIGVPTFLIVGLGRPRRKSRGDGDADKGDGQESVAPRILGRRLEDQDP